MTTPAGHVSWNKIWVVVAAVVVPVVSMSVIVVRGGQQLIDRVDVVTVKVNDMGGDIKQVKEDLKQLHIQVDTITHRQEIYQITNNYRLESQRVYQPRRQSSVPMLQYYKDDKGITHSYQVKN